jgi:hypothetical protein
LKQIPLETYLMDRHLKWPNEYNNELELNAKGLLVYVNDLLKQLDLDVELSSGFRPPSYNKTVKGAAKGSKHQTCQAIDLRDPKGELAKLFLTEGILEEFNLYMEDPKYTKGWTHLQSIPPKSGRRVFKP